MGLNIFIRLNRKQEEKLAEIIAEMEALIARFDMSDKEELCMLAMRVNELQKMKKKLEIPNIIDPSQNQIGHRRNNTFCFRGYGYDMCEHHTYRMCKDCTPIHDNDKCKACLNMQLDRLQQLVDGGHDNCINNQYGSLYGHESEDPQDLLDFFGAIKQEDGTWTVTIDWSVRHGEFY